jgi:hypothetical protein
VGPPGAGGGAPSEPVAASDEDLGSWVDDAALVVVLDRCAGTRSIEMDGPSGRLRLDDEEIPAAPGAASCRAEERFEPEGDGS